MKWLLVFLAGMMTGANAVYFLLTREDATAPITQIEAPLPAASPLIVYLPPVPHQTPLPIPQTLGAPASLLLPVQGVSADHLTNTFADARSGGRVHSAIDIMAPHGTPVFAVADGHVEKLHDSKGGGLSLYQFDPGNTFVYYYAHLQGYAPGIHEGKQVRRGDVVGFVGSTGNASASAPHLHFGVSALDAEKKWHQGTPINPYPLLSGATP